MSQLFAQTLPVSKKTTAPKLPRIRVTKGLIESAAVVPRAETIYARPLTSDSVAELSSLLEAQLFLVRKRQLDPSLASSPRVLFQNSVFVVLRAAPEHVRRADGRVDRSTARETVADSATAA